MSIKEINLKDLYGELNADQDLYAGSVDEDLIHDVEKNLNLLFSDEYIKFVRQYGCAIVGGFYIFGLKTLSIMGDTLNTVLSNTLFYRDQNWPGLENCYVISDDGRGNPIYMDREGKVWLSDHDSGFETILLADSFNEFLIKIYEDRSYD